MTRFLHTADWQLGLEARHVARAGEAVRAARLETVARLLELARRERAEFVLVAGDLFEDNQVSDELVHRVLRLLREAALPVLLLPGNHDCLGPTSVYRRTAFRDLPAPIRLLDEPRPCEVRPGVWVLPAPLSARSSRDDPTGQLEAQETPEGALRIGLAHGSLRIEGSFREDDHPIALDACRRLRLDYLALGHWHSALIRERAAYPGTPEPTGFAERESGKVLLVDLEPGAAPRLERAAVGGLSWQTWEEPLDGATTLEELARELKARVASLPAPGRTLLRVCLSGAQPPGAAAALRDLEAFLSAGLLFAELDASGLRLPADGERMGLLREGHPLLDRLVGALRQPETIPGLGLAIEEGDLEPEVLREAMLILEELALEVWP